MADQNEMEQILFQLILHAGSARSFAKESGQYAEEGDWEAAEKALEEANQEQNLAHKVNTTIITKAARGEEMEISVLMVHALDLLMLAWSEIDYTEQYLKVLKRVDALETEVQKWRDQASKK
ncbi:MAG: PTS lactose/cellobiose transporter subunit IIA [Pelolinea sp.]|nr:PTS lactose/cellobiose transporter subunit IIA [Pelolinea sp.]